VIALQVVVLGVLPHCAPKMPLPERDVRSTTFLLG
jgi:hypothetical protein